jgi:hypothetical protein
MIVNFILGFYFLLLGLYFIFLIGLDFALIIFLFLLGLDLLLLLGLCLHFPNTWFDFAFIPIFYTARAISNLGQLE